MSKKAEELRKFERQVRPDQYFKSAQTEFRDFYNSNLENIQAAEKAFRNLSVLLLKNQEFPEPKVSSRVKNRSECIRKFDGKYRLILEESGEEYTIKDHITDLIGVRIVCLYESDIEKASDILCSQFKMIEKTDKTREIEETESEFGYKGLHLDLKLDDERKVLPEYVGFGGQQFEVQIRTIVQDAWSEVDHKLKYKKEIPSDLKRRIYRLAALFELADQEFESIKDVSNQYTETASSKEFDEKSSKLNIFGFIRVATEKFPGARFGLVGVDTLEKLVSEINEAKFGIKVDEFRDYLDRNLDTVDEYREYLSSIGNSMNPYTRIRHCLYKENNNVFGHLIFDGHRKNFDRWLKHGTVFPNEIE